MKKTVKSLIIAASVAAIAGIGAVSFAAWQGGTTSKTTNGGVTGHVDTTGFGNGSTTTLTTQLMPHDQTIDTEDATTLTTVYHIKLVVEGNDASNYKIQGNYTAKHDETAYSWATGSKLEYKIDQTATTAYGTGWTEWTANGSQADLVGGGTLTAGDYYVHVALTSEDAADMDATLAFSFKLVEKE